MPTNIAIYFIFYCILPFFGMGCAYQFTNANRYVSAQDRISVYLPTAIDSSPQGGAAGLVSAAIRRQIELSHNVYLAPEQDARVGLDVRITGRDTSLTEIEKCTPAIQRIAGNAYSCTTDSIYQPNISSLREQMSLTVTILAIDMRTGRTLLARTLSGEQLSAQYYVIADSETDEGKTIIRGLANTPELHSLRYLENRDSTIATLSGRIASAVLREIQSIKL